MIRFCLRANWRRHTDVKQGSDEWKRHKSEGGSFGSSQCAAVFPGVSTTCSHPELVESLHGKPQRSRDAFAVSMMQKGQDMEPALREECVDVVEKLSGRRLAFLVPNQFALDSLTFGAVQERSSPDCIMIDHDDYSYALAEIKYRPASPKDCGWGPKRDELGLTVWCQAQHQMFVTDIDVCYVYSGSPCGARRLWRVDYCQPFRPKFVAALEWCWSHEDDVKHPFPRVKSDLTTLMEKTSELLYAK